MYIYTFLLGLYLTWLIIFKISTNVEIIHSISINIKGTQKKRNKMGSDEPRYIFVCGYTFVMAHVDIMARAASLLSRFSIWLNGPFPGRKAASDTYLEIPGSTWTRFQRSRSTAFSQLFFFRVLRECEFSDCAQSGKPLLRFFDAVFLLFHIYFFHYPALAISLLYRILRMYYMYARLQDGIILSKNECEFNHSCV